jgi:hypothetical protein
MQVKKNIKYNTSIQIKVMNMSKGNEIEFKCKYCDKFSLIDFNEMRNACEEQYVLLQCANTKCEALNLTNKERINAAVRDADSEGNMCECIPFAGEEAKLPRGKNTYANGTVLYGAANGELLTREQFITEYGNDPEKTLEAMWKGRIKPPMQTVHPGHISPPIKVLGRYTAR